MLKRVVEKGFNGRVKEWKTKHLRDAFMNGLLQAKITQEVKDAMVGHKRQGAREDYAITEQTIKVAYESAFKFLTINGYGSTSRKVEQLEATFKNKIAEIEQKRQEGNETLLKALKDLQDNYSEIRNQMFEMQKGQLILQEIIKTAKTDKEKIDIINKLKLMFESEEN